MMTSRSHNTILGLDLGGAGLALPDRSLHFACEARQMLGEFLEQCALTGAVARSLINIFICPGGRRKLSAFRLVDEASPIQIG